MAEPLNLNPFIINFSKVEKKREKNGSVQFNEKNCTQFFDTVAFILY